MLIGWLVWVLDGFMVDHNSESSLVVVVNAKQYLDQSLMHLKKLVLGNLSESFSLGRWYFEVLGEVVCTQCE